MRSDEATRLGEMLVAALTRNYSGRWSIYVSSNSFDPSILERDGVRKEVKFHDWVGPEKIRDVFFKAAEEMVPPEELDALKPKWWLLFWRCSWCNVVFESISGDAAMEKDVDFLFTKDKFLKHNCEGEGHRRGKAPFVGMRQAKPDEVERLRKERGDV